MIWMILLKWLLFLQLWAVAGQPVGKTQGCDGPLGATAQQEAKPNGLLAYRLLTTPSQSRHTFSRLADRILIRLNNFKELDRNWLSPDGQKEFETFMLEVDPLKILSNLAEKFGVSAAVAQKMLFVDGESLIQAMFRARNEKNWNEVIRIYDDALTGAWKNVTEAKLQTALALNRRNQADDRNKALRYADDVITANQGKAILSEAYGIKARIYKDKYEETKSVAYLDEAIQLYMTGFNSNPMDYYPGIAGINLLIYKGTKDSWRQAEAYAEKVQMAVDAQLASSKEKNQAPNFWLLATALNLCLIRGEWEKVSALLPDVLNNSAGPQNLETTLNDLKRILEGWELDTTKTSEQKTRLKGVITIFEKALKNTSADLPLSEQALSYVSGSHFADMEDAFGTKAFYLKEEIAKSEIEADLLKVSPIGDPSIMSFHKFLQTLKPEDANRGILLAPTGPYKEVIQAIADQTGLTPWWTAHSDLGVDLDPYSAVEFLKKVKVSGRQIYFLIPRNFKTFHKNSHTFKEYKLLMSNFSEHVSSTTFVFGFEKNFPLDYKRRLTAQDEKKKLTTQEVKKDYEDRIVRIFLTKFKKWLESMGSEVPSYKLKTDFQTSLYPVIYHQVLSKLTAHKVARKMHSEAMPTGPVRLLDLGGGTGLVTLQLMKDDHRRGVEIFDSSEAMLDMAVGSGVSIDKVHLSKVTHLVRRSGYLVESNSIDGITCSNVLYLLSELTVRRFFKEAHRVLKSGGRLSISSMLKTSAGVHQLFLESVFKEAEVLEREGKLPLSSKNILKSSNNQLLRQNPTFFNFEEISQMAKSFGFKPVGEPQFVYGKAGFFIVLEKN